MSLNEKFMEELSKEIKVKINILELRECLIEFRNAGMDKDSMIKNFEKMRENIDLEKEDILLELMDFVVGYCDAKLCVF